MTALLMLQPFPRDLLILGRHIALVIQVGYTLVSFRDMLSTMVRTSPRDMLHHRALKDTERHFEIRPSELMRVLKTAM